MYPSSWRMRAISTFSFEDGISARSGNALLALRMRVSMSATGSVIIGASPRALRHAGDDPGVGELPQANAAEPELLEHRARPPALVAAAVVARLVLVLPSGLGDERLLSHAAPRSRAGSPGREAALRPVHPSRR